MFNRDSIIVLIAAKERGKRVLFSDLYRIGLHHQSIPYLEEKGWIVVTGKGFKGCISLTAEGYYEARQRLSKIDAQDIPGIYQ